MNKDVFNNFNKKYNLFNSDEIDLIKRLIECKFISDRNISLLKQRFYSTLYILPMINELLINEKEVYIREYSKLSKYVKDYEYTFIDRKRSLIYNIECDIEKIEYIEKKINAYIDLLSEYIKYKKMEGGINPENINKNLKNKIKAIINF